MNRLDGKIAFISGGARGIGAETAQLMAQAGAKVAIGDVTDERGRETVRALEAAGGEALYVHLDVTREEDWARAIGATVDRFGGLDILVNNAGILHGKAIEETSLAEWRRLCDVNMTGVFLGTKAALPALRARGEKAPHGSSIVNLSSIAGLVGSQMDPLYSMTKGGVLLFTKSSALEFGRKGYRVRVNAVHPGLIETDMGAQAMAARARLAGTNDVEAMRTRFRESHPIGRLGVATDVAKGVLFLASDDSGFMTGSSLVIDGGYTAQ
jgi:NAD(P)-dependent dehydrogenase (short-subunit alcohol dehydrogenase family)